MDVVGQALDLITKYGLGLVGTVVLAFAVVWLGKQLQTSWSDRLVDERARADYIEKLRAEERAGRLDAEARLASNAETTRQATDAFLAAQRFMETLVAERTKPK